MSKALSTRTEVRVTVRGVTYAIRAGYCGPRNSIRPYAIHWIDARGRRHAIADIAAVLRGHEEWWLRCMASALRSGVEFAECPPGPEGDDQGEGNQGEGEQLAPDAPAGARRAHVTSSDPALCTHPHAFPSFSTDSEHCPHCGTTAPMGDL